MKDKTIWTKTLLMVYRYLERITGAIDKIIMQKALGSSNISGRNFFCNNVLTLSQNIIDLSERKVTLINLKILIDETLCEIPQQNAEILIEKFFDGVKSKQLCERHSISMRTVFRKIDEAVDSFSCRLLAKGYGPAKLSVWLGGEQWICNAYDRLQKNKEDELVFSSRFLERAASL